MTQEPQRDTRATRRGVLAGVGLVGLAGAVSACTSSGSPVGTSGGAYGGAGGGTTAAPSGPAASTPAAAGNGASALAATSEIPVGSGKIFTPEKVVVTQPVSGDFRAFSAVCTHMGCIVSQISGGTG